MTAAADNPLRDELRWMLRQARAPQIRTLRRFAEEEIVIPEGRYKGERFKPATQPFAGLWLDAVDSGRWPRVNTTGPTQTGKTLLACGIPLNYHLFEIGETVGFALPDMDMAGDKWEQDLLPMIRSTRYAALLPTTGEGSRGGKVKNAVTFQNGATLKFFTAGAGGLASDKSRAGFTCRVMIVTEKTAFATSGESSAEANKLEQLRARTLHYGSLARIYEESTVTTELDPVWTDLKQGTDSRIVSDCPRCGQFVSPEREHLVGWQEAPSVIAAKAQGHFVCPSCGEPISEQERAAMNRRAVLLHRGQTIAAVEEVTDELVGTARPTPLIGGEPPATDTLGFRWSAFNNLFRTAGDVAADEWRAARAIDEDDAERKMCQFVWCLPYQSPVEVLASIQPQGLTTRQAPTAKGLVPAETQLVTVGCDLGKWVSWYLVVAWLPDASSVVFDYEKLDVASELLGEEPALLKVLRQLRATCEQGWTWEGRGGLRPADLVSIDSAYKQNVVFQFIRECQAEAATRDRYWPVRGFGEGQLAGHSYHRPTKTGNQVRMIGDAYHATAFVADRLHVIEFDADAWKTFVHERLSSRDEQTGQPGGAAMRLYSALPKTHLALARHLTAEKQQVEFVPGKGERLKWVAVRRGNHWLDCSVGASVLAHFGGVRVLPETRGQGTGDRGQGEPPPAVVTPDGRPYSILER